MSACCKWRNITLNAAVDVVVSESRRIYDPILEEWYTATVNGNFRLEPDWTYSLSQSCKDIECIGPNSSSTLEAWALLGQNKTPNNAAKWGTCKSRAGISGWLPYVPAYDAIAVEIRFDSGTVINTTRDGFIRWSDLPLFYEFGQTVAGNLLPIGTEFGGWAPYPNPNFINNDPNEVSVAPGVMDTTNIYHRAQIQNPALYYFNVSPFVNVDDWASYLPIELKDGASASGDWGSVTITLFA